MRAIDSARRLACTSGFAVAAATSAAILVERVTQGAFHAAVLADVVITIVAISVAFAAWRAPLGADTAIWASLGAAAAIFAVHLVIAKVKPMPWLDEAPRQLVNDATAAIATLGLVFVVSSRRVELARFVAVTAPVATYALTHARWHLDRAPFATTVQQCVVAQFVSVALALFVFRAIRTTWCLR
jgi:hypothetical protein